MKTLIIYKSIHQNNTEKIAKRMAKVLNADLIGPEKFNFKQINKYDMIGLGSGIYGYKHHQTILDLADKLPDMKDKKVFVFSTSGMINKEQHKDLKERLNKKKIKIVDEFFCKGFDKNNNRENLNILEYLAIIFLQLIGGINKGRPNEDDLKKAEDFAKKIIHNLKK